MSIAESHSVREALSEILPALRAFLRLQTTSMMELATEPGRGITFKLPFTMFAIYILLVLGFTAFVDHDSIPAYEVLVVSLVANWIVAAAVVLGPFAFALWRMVGKDYLPHLITIALCVQILAMVGLFAASVWAVWPEHVRSDVYLLGKGKGEGTAVHELVCGGLERNAKWVSLNERTLKDLRANSARLSAKLTAPPQSDFENILAAGERDLEEAERSYDRATAMLNEAIAISSKDNEALQGVYREYPSAVQAAGGFALVMSILLIWFVIHMYKTFLECAKSMRQRPKMVYACTSALIVSASLSWFLYQAQQTRMPDMDFKLGPDVFVQMNEAIREMEDFGERQRHALNERKERLSLYCPKAAV